VQADFCFLAVNGSATGMVNLKEGCHIGIISYTIKTAGTGFLIVDREVELQIRSSGGII